jgi:glycosyltransferase involved in cell wall biosynthesis
MVKYSIVIPVYNRPDEVDELLQSLTEQTFTGFEVIVVEDGSTIPCEEVVRKYTDRLDLKYFVKPNSGPGQSRNYGVERSEGEFVIVLDSDVVLPPGYLQAVEDELSTHTDAFGGPDRAHESFSDVQKAINYSMTSFFTTGGIRGGKKQMDKKFYPRSFNMGIRRELYQQLGGFSEMRFGEDIDFSIRIYESGATCRLFPEAWVWHKRRTDFRKFFKQVHNSGIARINLMKRHPGTLKLVHLLPMIFTVGTFLCLLFALLASVISVGGYVKLIGETDDMMRFCALVEFIVGAEAALLFVSPILLFMAVIFMDSSFRNKSIKIGFLSIWASFIQLIGYGTGFLRAWWLRCVCGRNEELQAFKHNFYQ